MPRAARRVQRRLLALRGELSSWGKVADAVQLDRGLVRRVALGQQIAPPAMRRVLYPEKARDRERPTLAQVRALRAELAIYKGILMDYTVGADKKAKAAGVISTERPSDHNTGISSAAALTDSTRIATRRNPIVGTAPLSV